LNILETFNNILWLLVTLFLTISSCLFTIKLHGKQFHFIKMIKEVTKKEHNNQGISSFKALMLSLAGRIGVGSISGIALAIYLAGPGTIFWIWIISLISAILSYVESYLGVKHKELNQQKNYNGGPAYYIKNGLKNKQLGAIYSIMIIISYCGSFMLIQANTITKTITEIFPNTNPVYLGIILSLLTYFIIFGGIKKITDTTSKLVPIMSLGYLSITIYVIITNFQIIPQIFEMIFFHAFNYKSFTSGFLVTMLTGIQRGIFSSEAGIGTGSIAAASSNSFDSHSQGLIQMLGVYVTSFLICTSTAIIILTSDYQFFNILDPNGIELAINAFTYHLNYLGNIFLIIAIFLFAFSTILSGYFYGETSLKYLINNHHYKYQLLLKFFVCIIIFLGTITSSAILWITTDILVALLTLINLYAINKLKKDIPK